MLVKNQLIEMTWGRNKKYYTELGYEYTGAGNIFFVKAEDLALKSKKVVKIICDFCGKELKRPWRDYLKYHSGEFGDTCNQCKTIKSEKTCIEKYGERNPSMVKEIKEKRTETILERFGVENAFQNEEIKEKAKQTNLEKYGCEYISQSPEIQLKIQETNLEKFGFSNPNKSEEIKEKIKKTCLDKYGCEYYLQTEEARIKINNTLCSNGKVPTSKQQLKVFEILKEIYDEVYLNFPVDKCALDCMVNIDGLKIDVEYDGWYWHKDNRRKDCDRNFFLMTKGYKILRIRGNYEIPTKEQIKEGIDCLVKGKKSVYYIDLDI